MAIFCSERIRRLKEDFVSLEDVKNMGDELTLKRRDTKKKLTARLRAGHCETQQALTSTTGAQQPGPSRKPEASNQQSMNSMESSAPRKRGRPPGKSTSASAGNSGSQASTCTAVQKPYSLRGSTIQATDKSSNSTASQTLRSIRRRARAAYLEGQQALNGTTVEQQNDDSVRGSKALTSDQSMSSTAKSTSAKKHVRFNIQSETPSASAANSYSTSNWICTPSTSATLSGPMPRKQLVPRKYALSSDDEFDDL